MRRLVLFSVALFASCILPCRSQDNAPFAYVDEQAAEQIENGLQVLEDPLGKLTPEAALARHNWTPAAGRIANLGITPSVFWVKLNLKNYTNAETLLIGLFQPNLDEITFYDVNSRPFRSEKTGISFPYRQRPHDSHYFLFDVELPSQRTGTYLLRLQSNSQIQLPLVVGTPKAIQQRLVREDIYMGLYMGVVLAMFLYNLFVFFSIRSRSYLFYVPNILLLGLTQATFQGYTYRLLWPGLPWVAQHAPVVLTVAACLTGMMFICVMLRIRRTRPHLHKGLQVFAIAGVLLVLLCLVGFEQVAYRLTQLYSLLAAVGTLAAVFVIYRQGSRTAGFVLLAWCIFLMGICVFILKDFNLLPYNDFTNNIMLIGSAAEMILLSFALADRINKLKKEKERSHRKMVEALQANEKLIQEENLRLEAKVRERTRALEESTEELQATLANLKNTQSQLLQAEKMASLGLLTAGIAHEINNPINFVSASVKPLRRDVGYLWQLIDKYAATLNGDNPTAELEAFKQRLDVDYVRQEITELLNGVETGAARTAAIVRGLRNFSRLDNDTLAAVDIHEGLDSTLLLLNHTLKDNIRVQKDYNLQSMVECQPGKLNQVFINILHNAAQAIKAKGENGGTLTIRTWAAKNKACIGIRDTGIGMSASTRTRVFEPFFTTKNVGEGTGLGLSIAFGIIEAHKGDISVESAEGVGTEFVISLPLVQSAQPVLLAAVEAG
ncbi:MAG: ATP-binding protein [Cytophagales bacterium]|jgi:signal transduction histidine kinase|nr:ATP-binding protein [Cytophagales bacterium]